MSIAIGISVEERICLILSVFVFLLQAAFGLCDSSDSLTKTHSDPFADRPTIHTDTRWEDVGVSANTPSGSTWGKDLFSEQLPLGLDLTLFEDGQPTNRPAFSQSIVTLLQSLDYRVLQPPFSISDADYLLHIEVRINTLRSALDRYYTAIATSDYVLEDLRREHRKYHMEGPRTEDVGVDSAVATDQALRRMERALTKSLQQQLKTDL